jgi:peptidoglycan hydrolase-like amidase
MKVTSYHDIPSWNPGLDDNLFRGTIEVRYSPVSNAVWVVNELPLEHYMRGIAETSSGSPSEFLKTMTVAARSYAFWHLERGGKYGSSEIFHLKNSRNGNGDDQQFKGYGLEARFPDLATAVVSTGGQVVTYGGSVAMTSYFSNTDGRTRSAQEVWGITYWPWLQSVSDPDCAGMTQSGHGVGLSGHGAFERASRGQVYTTILGYYYTGTTVQTLDTNRNIRIAIARVS